MIAIIDAPHFYAAALWRKTVSGWECYHAAPIIRYMVGMSPAEVKKYLERKRWKNTWLPAVK